MPTSYTSLLGLALPVQGELVGTWGDEVNNYITQYLDASIAGTQTISGSQTAVTLSKTTGTTLSQAGAGATGSAQYQIINCTGNPSGLLTITAPAVSKVYLVLNNTSTSQSVKIVGAGPTTGVTVAAAQCALVAWNGSDFEVVASTDVSILSGVLPVAKGGTGLSSTPTNGQLLIGNGTGFSLAGITAGSGVTVTPGSGSITISATGTGGTVTSVAMTVPSFLSVSGSPITGSGTLGVSYSGTALPVANGGTGTTSLTANTVLLGNGTSAVQFVAPGTNGNVLTSDGTTWTSAAAPTFTQVYPGAGIAVSTGTAWGTSKTSPTGDIVGTSDTQTLTNKTIRQMTQVISTNTTAAASNIYVLTASLTLTLPASPTAGDWVGFSNRSGTTTPVIARNGQNIMGLAENLTLDSVNASGTLVFADATRGWIFVD